MSHGYRSATRAGTAARPVREARGTLANDLEMLEARASRRQVLHWALGTSLGALTACGDAPPVRKASAGHDPAACIKIPEETEGPFPGDGTNGVNALILEGIVRRDLRSSLAGSSARALGAPLRLRLVVRDSAEGCRPRRGCAVYAWHCDRDGHYSMYSEPVVQESYLRGVQETGEDGSVEFVTIFPGCYPGRWPHVHFEVYPSLAMATGGAHKIATSQLAFPEATCLAAYGEEGYEESIQNLSRVSLASDGIFRDGFSHQIADMSGGPESEFWATLTVTV